MSADPGRRHASLLCDLGRHKAGSFAHWNDGYYFSKCRRCGQDLVRTAFGRWTVPQGYRVVWAADPPPRTRSVQLIRVEGAGSQERAVDAGRANAIEFPIRETAQAAETASAPEAAVEPATNDPTLIQRADEDGPVSSIPADLAAPAESKAAGGNDIRPIGVTEIAQGVSEPHVLVPGMLLSPREETGPSASAAALAVPGTALPDPVPATAAHLDMGQDQPVDEDEALEPQPAPEEKHSSGPVEESDIVAGPQTPALAPEDARLLIPDFMNGGSFAVPYDLRTGALLPPTGSDGDVESESPRFSDADAFEGADGLGDRVRRMTSARASTERRARPDRRSAADRSDPPQVDPRRHRATFLERQGGVVAAALFGGLVLAAALVDNHGSDAARNLYRPMTVAQAPVVSVPVIAPVSPAVAPVAPIVEAVDPIAETLEPVVEQADPTAPATPLPAVPASAPGDDRAYVTASLLNCRAVPNDDAATVRRLRRGAPVQVLGVDPGWINISHGGQRCWASAEYISTVRPV